ncbi:MAG: hypothetical protein GXY05_04045, partial [Clostridiales bacterium]|nr:hypothetical protein [Clostridiales bacterium]
WHMMTAAEWGLVALHSLRLNTLPYGNTYDGIYYGAFGETGIRYKCASPSFAFTLTGSGPRTWSHNHREDGVYDLCGNADEMICGLRLIGNELQYISDNNAAISEIDLGRNSSKWKPVTSGGKKVFIASTTDTDEVTISNNSCNLKDSVNLSKWRNVIVDVSPSLELLTELALFDGEPSSLFKADCNMSYEILPTRGGNYASRNQGGIFNINLYYLRGNIGASRGFRVAYYEKTPGHIRPMKET